MARNDTVRREMIQPFQNVGDGKIYRINPLDLPSYSFRKLGYIVN